MKIKFNEIGGKVNKDPYTISCYECIFNNTKFCIELNSNSPLFITCRGYIFLKSNLDIFEL